MGKGAIEKADALKLDTAKANARLETLQAEKALEEATEGTDIDALKGAINEADSLNLQTKKEYKNAKGLLDKMEAEAKRKEMHGKLADTASDLFEGIPDLHIVPM